MKSFRLKIGLLSVALTGVVLLAFGLFFMSVIKRIGFERIDRELRALADDPIRKPKPMKYWKQFDESLKTIYGNSRQPQFIIKAVTTIGTDYYVSPHWPAELTDIQLPILNPPSKPRQLSAPPNRVPGDRLNEEAQPGESPTSPPESMTPPPPVNVHVRGPVYTTIVLNGISRRILVMGNDEVTLYIGMDLTDFYGEIQQFQNIFMIGLPIVLLFLSFSGWLIAQRAIRPVKVIASTAERITTRELGRRIPKISADKEFAGLIDVINGMLDRLEKSFQQAMRFSGDAAHELKTPLTILQGELEQALQESPDGSESQQRYRELLEEVRRLSAITQRLLLLSQADSGQMKITVVPYNLSAALESLEEDIGILEPTLKVEKDISPNIHVMVDANMMNQVLHNLISNAIKYNKKNGWIRLTLNTEGNKVIFTISNTGKEIPKQDHEKIFDRFYRVDKSHARNIEGAGLGLSLAREIVLAHKGELRLEYSGNGITTFSLQLPQTIQGTV